MSVFNSFSYNGNTIHIVLFEVFPSITGGDNHYYNLSVGGLQLKFGLIWNLYFTDDKTVVACLIHLVYK